MPARPDLRPSRTTTVHPMTDDLSRRRFLAGLGAASGLALTGVNAASAGAATPPTGIRQPGDRPYPRHPEGTEFLPRIEHIVIYMQENHSYDSYFGMLPRGDGYTLHKGVPQNQQPPARRHAEPAGVPRPRHLPARARACRRAGRRPTPRSTAAAWTASWPTATPTPCATGTRPTCPSTTRWPRRSRSATAGSPRPRPRPIPNRLYLQAATCQTLISTDIAELLALPHPAGGTIWDKLNAFGISWIDYAWDLPDIALFPHTYRGQRRQGEDVRPVPERLPDRARCPRCRS